MLAIAIREALANLITAVCYRIRGGGWFTIGSDTICRLIWSSSLCVSYLLVAGKHGCIFYALALIVLGFVEMMVPHAWVQNMGRWPTPQVKWPMVTAWRITLPKISITKPFKWYKPVTFTAPTFYLACPTQAQWDAMSLGQRTAYDFAGMMCVGWFRGAIVFLPIGVTGAAYGHYTLLIAAFVGIVVLSFLAALAYLVGINFPLTITKSLEARSSEWGEFFSGPAHTLALTAFTAVLILL